MKNPAEFTYSAKNYWHKNSDKLKCDWETFCTIWMASINEEKSEEFGTGGLADAMMIQADESTKLKQAIALVRKQAMKKGFGSGIAFTGKQLLDALETLP